MPAGDSGIEIGVADLDIPDSVANVVCPFRSLMAGSVTAMMLVLGIGPDPDVALAVGDAFRPTHRRPLS